MFLLIHHVVLKILYAVFDLHSTMFLLIQRVKLDSVPLLEYLHSTMFLLIRTTGSGWKEQEQHLHSTMFLLILVLIPCLISLLVFTFHNVSINSVFEIFIFMKNTSFTFHNVSINSMKEDVIEQIKENLHSTMFLLIPAHKAIKRGAVS